MRSSAASPEIGERAKIMTLCCSGAGFANSVGELARRMMLNKAGRLSRKWNVSSSLGSLTRADLRDHELGYLGRLCVSALPLLKKPVGFRGSRFCYSRGFMRRAVMAD